MRYLKHFSRALCLGGSLWMATGVANAVPQTLPACLEEGKQLYSQQNYPQAVNTFTHCLTLDPGNVEAHLSLAGVFLTQDKLEEAQTHFEAALKNMSRTSPYWSYTYSMLGDIALKRRNYKEAFDMYSKSLQYNAANVNSLIGKGVILEDQGNKPEAAKAYRSALAMEPLNVIARERLVALEPEYFTDDEILTALKQRYVVKPEEMQLSNENRELFTKIHRAEQRKGVEYLKNKYGANTQDFIVTLNKGTDFERQMLSLNGYNALQQQIGQDAVTAFVNLKVPMQDVFALRDKQGKKIFTPESTLTESGFQVYTQALAGKKEFLLPNEVAPLTAQEKKVLQQRVQKIRQRGYVEISHAELKMLEDETMCSLDTLKKDLGVYALPVANNKQALYFVRSTDLSQLKTVPYYYVMKYRQKRNPKLEVPKNSVVDLHQFYNYKICLSDGKLTMEEDSSLASGSANDL